MTNLDDLIIEILVIKDLYICGRMNSLISENLSGSAHKLQEFNEIALKYVSDSVLELKDRIALIDSESLRAIDEQVFQSLYTDFDKDLFNELMEDYYGSATSISFATSYNYFSEDFNSLIIEFMEIKNND